MSKMILCQLIFCFLAKIGHFSGFTSGEQN